MKNIAGTRVENYGEISTTSSLFSPVKICVIIEVIGCMKDKKWKIETQHHY